MLLSLSLFTYARTQMIFESRSRQRGSVSTRIERRQSITYSRSPLDTLKRKDIRRGIDGRQRRCKNTEENKKANTKILKGQQTRISHARTTSLKCMKATYTTVPRAGTRVKCRRAKGQSVRVILVPCHDPRKRKKKIRATSTTKYNVQCLFETAYSTLNQRQTQTHSTHYRHQNYRLPI